MVDQVRQRDSPRRPRGGGSGPSRPPAAPSASASFPRSAPAVPRPQGSFPRLMDPLEALAIVAAGIAAGAINAVVGSGTPDHLPGADRARLPAAGRQRLQQHRPRPGRGRRRLRLPARAARPAQPGRSGSGVFSVLGGIAGATLLLELPASAFDAIVPILIAIALVLVVAPAADRPRPRRPARAEGRARRRAAGGDHGERRLRRLLRRRPGHPARRHPRDRDPRRPPAPQRAQERARRARQRDRGPDLRLRGRRRLGGRRPDRRRLDRSAGCVGAHYGRRLEPNVLRALIVVLGLVAIARLTFG